MNQGRLFGFCLVFLCTMDSLYSNPSSSIHTKERGKTILVFGGNGFMGAATVEKLIRRNDTVVIVNRGNWYYDSATRIKPYVTHLRCDRMRSLQKCEDLQHYLWAVDAPSYFDAVIDFSAYHPFVITEAMQLLQGKIMRYIYISSDSVYEVCTKNHSRPTREEDAVRPASQEDQDALKEKDAYGHGKLEGEEELERLYKLSGEGQGVPYISLRLPDVIGPRDTTYRWWLYQLWIKLHKYLDRQLSVPADYWNKPMSFVYVDDVADVILDCIDLELGLYNEAYNLAMDETPTLVNFLHSLMDELDVEDLDIQKDDSGDALKLLPSVTRGTIDVTKAKRLLKWNPTSWHEVLAITTKFYEDAVTSEQFLSSVKDVIRKLQQNFSKDANKVLVGFYREYGLRYPGMRDEL